jgi:hypothetical protein
MDDLLELDFQTNFEDKVYDPQFLLGTWMGVSFFFVTTALLFYHMTKEKLVRYNWFGGGYALFLMFIAMSFIIVSIVIYNKRMNKLLNTCLKQPNNCSKQNYQDIKNLKDIFTILAILIIISKCVVIYFLINHIFGVYKDF